MIFVGSVQKRAEGEKEEESSNVFNYLWTTTIRSFPIIIRTSRIGSTTGELMTRTAIFRTSRGNEESVPKNYVH